MGRRLGSDLLGPVRGSRDRRLHWSTLHSSLERKSAALLLIPLPTVLRNLDVIRFNCHLCQSIFDQLSLVRINFWFKYAVKCTFLSLHHIFISIYI